MTTITLATIISSLTTTIRDLTPTSISNVGFERCERRHRLRTWAAGGAGTAIFRKFEIRRSGPRQDHEPQDPSAVLVRQPLMLLVAYPGQLTGLAGEDQLDDLEDLIACEDAPQLRDAIWSPSNLAGSGHEMSKAMVGDVERDGAVWFLPIAIEVTYWRAQSL